MADYDDGLMLNLASDEDDTSKSSVKKKGRWTDRVKAKRVAKRKHTQEVKLPANDAEERPTKRPRTEVSKDKTTTTANAPPSTTAKSTHVISSLFSSNPKVVLPTQPAAPKKLSKPSNAPLTDASTFVGLGVDPLIDSHLSTKMGISKPTSIQLSVLAPLISTLPKYTSRDVFIQSQTGSGKTLSYLIPIIQDLLPLSTQSYIDRSIGTLAVILAPTRELAKQISDVLESLLKLRLRPESESAEESTHSLTRWLVSGLLTGGHTRTHEKARLRKGVPILVATPGRLLDHLQNTSALNIGKCRWLILDEADRLMELGFEETITGIIRGLDGRRKLALQAVEDGTSAEVGGWDWERRRRTVLCSATMREDVQKLSGETLCNPLMIKATEAEGPQQNIDSDGLAQTKDTELTPPSQLAQKYVVVPLKLRLVALVALLRMLVAQSKNSGARIIVFLSCTASVDFHWSALNSSSMGEALADDNDDSSNDEDESKPPKDNDNVEATSQLLPGVSIFRLHGSLPTSSRLSAVNGFIGSLSAASRKNSKETTPQNKSSVLLCTSVASRGLDLPHVRAVIQCDLPTEGGATEYVHRIGRTARAGKGGEAWSFVAPSEQEWVKWVVAKMQGGENKDAASSSAVKLTGVAIENVLASGFGCSSSEYEQRATDVQLSFERWVLRNKANTSLAQNAYLSHMRAYATHPSSEKHIFHIRNLHIGHLAKAFALRDAPKAVSRANNNNSSKKTLPEKTQGRSRPARHEVIEEENHEKDAEKRMREMVRKQGRLSKKGGLMVSGGTSEFQIASGYALEKMVGQT